MKKKLLLFLLIFLIIISPFIKTLYINIYWSLQETRTTDGSCDFTQNVIISFEGRNKCVPITSIEKKAQKIDCKYTSRKLKYTFKEGFSCSQYEKLEEFVPKEKLKGLNELADLYSSISKEFKEGQENINDLNSVKNNLKNIKTMFEKDIKKSTYNVLTLIEKKELIELQKNELIYINSLINKIENKEDINREILYSDFEAKKENYLHLSFRRPALGFETD